MAQITIGPEFFQKAKNDYSDWEFALIREFMQNSIDCGSKNIFIKTDRLDDRNVRLSVVNDGEVMTKEILLDKLLSLGSSGKDFQEGNVGGFGKAKEILYFCHESYDIHSGSLRVVGRGATYNLQEDQEYVDGTISRVVVSGMDEADIHRQVRYFVNRLEWKGKIFLNGTPLQNRLRATNHRKDLSFGKVYTNCGKYVKEKGLCSELIVRIHGIPMFSDHLPFHQGTVILEITKTSGEVLTSNRDSMSWNARHEFRKFSNEVIVDKSSALRDHGSTTRRFSGRKLEGDEQGSPATTLMQGIQVAAKVSLASLAGEGSPTDDAEPSTLEYEFFVKNETGMATPKYYEPTEKMGTYAKRLANAWGKILVQLHRTFKVSDTFSIGFVLSEECEAQHFRSGDTGRIYYINPATVVTQTNSNSRSMKNRFSLAEKNRLIMIGLHEFVHGLGYRIHDEAYSTKLTDMAWVVMDNLDSFKWCFN